MESKPGLPPKRGADAAPGRGGLVGKIVLGLVLVAALASSRPLYHRLVQWRAQSIVDQAQELVRLQLFPEAIEKLNDALRVDPACVRGLRTLSDIYSRFELPAALPLLKAIVASPARTDDDVRDYIDAALKLQRFDLAEGELARLLAQPPISSSTRILATEYFYRMGDMPRALSFANDIRREDPTNNVNHLRVAKILLNTPNPERQEEGVNLLVNLRDLSAMDRINIAQILATAPGLPPGDVKELLRLIPDDAEAHPTDYLLRCDVLLRLQPAERAHIVSGAVARFRAGTPQQQGDLCAWLLRQNEHSWITRSFTAAEAVTNAAVAPTYLEALTRNSQWAELQKAAAAQMPVETWLAECYRALGATRLNQQSLADEHWRRAFDAAGGSPVKLRNLGDTAFRLGLPSAAIRAFQQLSENKLYRSSALGRLAQVYERERNADALRSVMQSWAASGDNPYAENAYCYLSGLLGKDVDDAGARAERLFQSMPARLTFRATHAFLKLRRGDGAGALQLFERAAITTRDASPQVRLIHAAVLDGTGHAEDARKIAKSLKPESFLPEEQTILRRLSGG